MGGLLGEDDGNNSVEELDSDDLGGGLQLSDDESGVAVREMRR